MPIRSFSSVRPEFNRKCFLALSICHGLLIFPAGHASASSEQADYLQKDFNLSCHGLETFDFIFEAGQLVGEWCREQNARLGERGCGEDSDMCVEEFIRADRPGASLSLSIGAAYMRGDASVSGSDVILGDSRWIHSSDKRQDSEPKAVSSWSTDFTQNRIQVLFGIGFEIPLGARTVVRKTCVNPLASTHLEMLTNSVIKNNFVIQRFAQNCYFARKF